MKTAARRASRRLTGPAASAVELLHRRRRRRRPRRRTCRASASATRSCTARADLGHDPAVRDGELSSARARPSSSSTPSRRRPLRSRAPSTDATAPPHDLAQRRLAHAHRAAVVLRRARGSSSGQRRQPRAGLLEEGRRVLAAAELVAVEDLAEHVARGRHALDLELARAPARARSIARRRLPSTTIDLRDQRVVVRRDRRPVLDERVDADARPERRPEALDPPRRRREAARGILGVDPQLDRVPAARAGAAAVRERRRRPRSAPARGRGRSR